MKVFMHFLGFPQCHFILKKKKITRQGISLGHALLSYQDLLQNFRLGAIAFTYFERGDDTSKREETLPKLFISLVNRGLLYKERICSKKAWATVKQTRMHKSNLPLINRPTVFISYKRQAKKSMEI